MNTKFDELTKAMAQSVTRRSALKKFGVGLAGMALAWFGLANKAGGKRNEDCETMINHGWQMVTDGEGSKSQEYGPLCDPWPKQQQPTKPNRIGKV